MESLETNQSSESDNMASKNLTNEHLAGDSKQKKESIEIILFNIEYCLTTLSVITVNRANWYSYIWKQHKFKILNILCQEQKNENFKNPIL